MGKQQTFASEAWSRKGKVTRRERFLAEMELHELDVSLLSSFS